MLNNTPKRILFFTPYAGRSGSEMFLWYMFSAINTKLLNASLVSECNGSLLNEMPNYVSTHVTLKYPNKYQRILNILARTVGIDLYNRNIIKTHTNFKPNYWYLNTVLMTDKIALAQAHNIPVITHFHELTTDYSLVTKQQLQAAINYSNLCIADSKAVYNKLQLLGAKNIVLQYECIDIKKINIDNAKSAQLKTQLDLDKYSFVWLMSGSTSTRKGTDMVPQLAQLLQQQNAALVWLGNNSSTGMDLMIEKEIKAMQLNNVLFLGQKKDNDYYNHMNIMDGFVLTSREEPFGMVVVEALALGKPVVSFNAGGVAEIVTSDVGTIVNSWNVPDLAAAMQQVSANITSFDTNKAKARAQQFDVSVQVANWEQIISNLA
jgi:L-malate glycosyltransferase